MKRLVIIGLLLAVCGLSVAAQNGKKTMIVWETGSIVEVEYTAGTKTITVTETDTSLPLTDAQREKPKDIALRDDQETVRFEAGGFTYTVYRQMKFINQNKLKLKPGDRITFAIKDDRIYLRTPDGKRIKYFYIGRAAKK